MRRQKNRNTGFTLIELLVVISLIGLLSSVVFASVSSARLKALQLQKFLEIRAYISAVKTYAIDNGSFPIQNQVSGTCLGRKDGETCPILNPNTGETLFYNIIKPYISSMPRGSDNMTFYGVDLSGYKYACSDFPIINNRCLSINMSFVVPGVLTSCMPDINGIAMNDGQNTFCRISLLLNN